MLHSSTRLLSRCVGVLLLSLTVFHSFGQIPSINWDVDAVYECDPSNLVPITNFDPSYQYNPLSWTNVNPGNFVVHPTGEIEISGSGISGPKGYGEVEIEVLDGNGNYLTTLIIYIVECCDGNTPDFLLVKKSASQIGFSGTISGATLEIVDFFRVDQNLDFDNSILEFHPDARMDVDPGVMMNNTSSTFTGRCDYRWDGIFASDPSNVLMFNSCRIERSIDGVYLQNSVTAEFIGNDFIDNYLSVVTQNYNSGLSPLFSANRFFGTINYGGLVRHPQSTVIVENYDCYSTLHCVTPGNFNQIPGIFIWLDRSSDIEVGVVGAGQENNFERNATFLGDGPSIAGTSSSYKVTNNVLDFQFAVCNRDCQMLFGGSTASSNTVNQAVVSTRQSSQYVSLNQFTGGGIEVNDPTNTVNPNGLTATRIIDNTFGSDASIYINGANKVRYVRIADNSIHNSTLAAYDIAPNSTNYLVVNNNTFSTNYYGSGSYSFVQAVVGNCANAQIGDNVFAYNPLSPPGSNPPVQGLGVTGLYVDASKDAVITDNIFGELAKGLQLGGNLGGTQFNCNNFENCMVGVFLKTGLTLSDQGSASNGQAGNDWTYTQPNNPPWSYVYTIELESGTYTNWIYYTPQAQDPRFAYQSFGVGVSSNLNSLVVINPTNLSCYSDASPFKVKPSSTSISEIEDLSVSLFPNPSSNGSFTVASNESIQSIFVYSLNGQLLYSENTDKKVYQNQRVFPVGVYFIQIHHQNGNVVTKKLLVH